MIPLSLHSSLPPPPPTTNPKNPSLNFSSTSPPRRRRFARRCRRTGWDSNAESVRTDRFGFRAGDGREEDGRKWWSDEPDDEFYDEFDGFDDEEEEENFWDKIWIFKVFKAYGYMLPAIIASMLLATGPKAFLMALALPLGQSAISLAIEKLWGRTYEEPRMKAKSRRKPFNRSTSFRNREKEERKSDYKGRNDYQSWDSAAESEVTDNASGSRRSTFGGWDELDDQKGSAGRKSSSGDGSAQDEPVKKGKLSRRGRYRDAPLFLRLLIAVFPFLGSWTRIL